MLMLEDVVKIKILYQQGQSIRTIAKSLNVSRNTVRRYLRDEISAPIYSERIHKPHKLDVYKTYLNRRVNAAHPNWLPATVLFEEIKAQGYQGGITRLRSYLCTLKPLIRTQEIVRFETLPGKQMQVDWA